MDNRLLNINGKSRELLALALNVAFEQFDCSFARAWIETSAGLVILWSDQDDKSYRFPAPLTHEQVVPIVWQWFQSKKPEDFTLVKWEENLDHDGDNKIGWRVYVEDWGHVTGISCAICAIKPVYLWYGK